MATSALFALIDALHETLTEALPNTLVFDGMGNTDDPGDFLMIGVEDPDTDTYANTADTEQSWSGIGNRARDEKGTVTCCALSWNGDSDPRAARLAVKATTDAVEAALRADPTVGGALPGAGWVQFGSRLTLSQIQSDEGAAALVFFQIAYQARI